MAYLRRFRAAWPAAVLVLILGAASVGCGQPAGEPANLYNYTMLIGDNTDPAVTCTFLIEDRKALLIVEPAPALRTATSQPTFYAQAEVPEETYQNLRTLSSYQGNRVMPADLTEPPVWRALYLHAPAGGIPAPPTETAFTPHPEMSRRLKQLRVDLQQPNREVKHLPNWAFGNATIVKRINLDDK